MLDKKQLTERDICTKFITPAIEKAGWNKMSQLMEEVYFTDGKIYVRGRLTARGSRKRADYILFYKPNIPVAIIEAKDNNHSIRAGIQQALDYSNILDIPYVFSSNGDGFLFHDKTINSDNIETELPLDEFPSPDMLWQKYRKFKGIDDQQEKIIVQDYFIDSSGKKPRYYQQIAINRTVEAIAKGQNRILLVMATGTGKTYTAFQIVYRLWKSGQKKRILFLADRNALIDQAARNDFKHLKSVMTKVKNRVVDKSYEVYLSLYQGLSGNEEDKNIYKQFSPDFFDLVIIDECHRGSARDDSAWREILEYFNTATQIGLTATPRETKDVSNIEYFDDPIYTYSLKQGIDDGFLAPYRVIRILLDKDSEGYRPDLGKTDKDGILVPDRIYARTDQERNIVLEARAKTVAKYLSDFLKDYDRFAKTIVFCVDIDHAQRMRQELVNQNSDLVSDNSKYVMQITGDNEEGKRELDNFTNPEETYPVIATTSELLTTGIDAETCKVIVLDSEIKSMTKFKQIIGRGTRVKEDFGKLYFTILDFRNVTNLFADPDFDGPPIRIKVINSGDPIDGVIGEEGDDVNDDGTIKGDNGEPVVIKPPTPQVPVVKDSSPQPRKKIYVNGVDVSVLISRELYFDYKGKPITTSLKDHTKEIIKKQFATLDDFLNKWSKSEQKTAIIDELKEQGIMVEALYDAVDKNLDLFDLICHLVFDQPPLTRKERASNVKKRNYFTKYGEQAKKVLDALLDKYANEGLENIESMEILKLKPISDLGSPTEIVSAFGSKENYLSAIKELEKQIYSIGA